MSALNVYVAAAHSQAGCALLYASIVVERYLVDLASSHMLVSKIKPCMSKYLPNSGETANGSLNHT